MAAIKLLPAPVDPPSALAAREASIQSTSLVPASRLALAIRSVTHGGAASRNLGDVWSVSVGDDGSFNFYAASPKNSEYSASSQWDDFQSARASASGWNTLPMRHAAAQYALHANMLRQTYAHFMDVYA
jgi:hypothetical protein